MTYLRALLSREFSRLRLQVRIRLLNRKPNMRISPKSYLGQDVKFQLTSDGYNLGGYISLSDGVRISDGVILAPYGGSIEIGENVFVGPYCVLYGHGGLRIGRDTLIAAHTVIIAANHSFENTSVLIREQPVNCCGIQIGENVWIGSGARILDGVVIGNGCVVGAGSVVTTSLEDFAVAVGVPAKVIKIRK